MKKLYTLALAASLSIGTFGPATESLLAQAISVNGGSIQGTITDPSGAVVGNCTITIAGSDTGSTKTIHTDSAGFYGIGPLNPGNYKITIAAAGFQGLSVDTVVRTGTATSGNFKLTLGASTETIEVQAGAVQINTDQVGVSAVLTQKDFDQLPVNGRNFLDYAQLQPGVQLQNGDYAAGGFDPTKAGYSALSFSGTSGRTTRILLDGQDITDETVGTTVFNVGSGSVGEMQVNRSVSDPSTDITSQGSIQASTRTGTNRFHGQLFYNFQDYRALFATVKGSAPPFQRNQFGGGVGGPIIKDKLFFFADVERLKQDSSTPTAVLKGASTNYFANIASQYPTVPAPGRDTYSAGRLDYSGPFGIHFFARANYEANAFTTGIGYALYANRDNVPGLAGGADFETGKFTHSFRGSYEKFHNLISPTANASLYNPFPSIYLSYGGQGLRTGLNDNAPQNTFQVDKQARYDGSWTRGRQNFRYGASLNRISGGGAANFFGAGPGVYLSSSSSSRYTGTKTSANPTGAGCGGVVGAPACSGDLANGYRPSYFYVGNNLGVSTEIPAFGLPGGGQGDWRIGIYINDAWKITPSFTLSIGARYDRDTGRTDSDLGAVPCSAIVADSFPGGVPCTGTSRILDQFGAGLGASVNQPNRNVGPQIGFNYAPAALHNKTSLRGAFGVFYESSVFNNNLFERFQRLATGKFNNYNLMCAKIGGQSSLYIPGKGTVSTNSAGVAIETMCNEPLSKAIPDILTLENDYKTGSLANAGPNPSFIGNTLFTNAGSGLFAPGYLSPYSLNFNFGIQQELTRGTVLTVDYVHNASLRVGQSHDANHVGDSRYLNVTAAKNAIATTTASYNCVGGSSSAAISCAIAAGARIADFAGNGLSSLSDVTGGAPISAVGGTPDTGAAFAGINPNVGTGNFQYPDGKSAYDGLQFNLREQKANPMRGLTDSTLEVSYAYSRFISSASGTGSSDQFFLAAAQDYRSPTQFMGYGSLDRTNIFSFGGSATVKYGPRIGFIGHFSSAPPTSLTLDTAGGTGQIFQTDVTGDGTTGDLLPGTNQGSYMRKIHSGDLKQAVANYNASGANRPTPAGQALVSAGLLSTPQLYALGAVTPTLGDAPSQAYPNSAYRQVDITLSYPVGHSLLHFLPESVNLEPVVAFYNALNLANFGGVSGSLLIDSTQAGSVNSPYDKTVRYNSRVTRGIGTFSQGSPRSTEFQLKLNF